MNNVLIPTDFSPASVKLAEQALQHTQGRQVNIIFFHAFTLPFYTLDLFGSGTDEPHLEVMNDTFRQACKQLKDEHPKAIGRIFFKSMRGNTAAIFRNFADANAIDMIYCPAEYVFRPVHRRSVDPVPLFRKSGISLVRQRRPANKAVEFTASRNLSPQEFNIGHLQPLQP
jgi:hypothetical protein